MAKRSKGFSPLLAIAIGLGVAGVLVSTQIDKRPPTPPNPNPVPTPNDGESLRAAAASLLAQVAADPRSTDPNALRELALTLDAAGLPTEAAQVRTAEAAVRAAQALPFPPPITNAPPLVDQTRMRFPPGMTNMTPPAEPGVDAILPGVTLPPLSPEAEAIRQIIRRGREEVRRELEERRTTLSSADRARIAVALRSTVIPEIWRLANELGVRGIADAADQVRRHAFLLVANAPPIADIPLALADIRSMYEAALAIRPATNPEAAEILRARAGNLLTAGFSQHGAFLARRADAVDFGIPF